MTLSARADAILVVTRLGVVNRPMLTISRASSRVARRASSASW